MHPVLSALRRAVAELQQDGAPSPLRQMILPVLDRAQALLDTAGSERFDEFWKLYPRKESKDAARKAWVRMEGDANAGAILENVRLRLRINEWNPLDFDRRRFIPHAATFLNQRRWLDRPMAPSPKDIRAHASLGI